ncbi:polyamine aminopropyltransferase [Xanthovirga aplysinae]|uniref:polyamine aminopropyltransferase n=1 Tax=Xanthovirga aplysinae TaxID=2529853 RepID=UPI0012BD4461|nr:polyamine aminopropyltransferase [Xanthovirga aplysinae]MTI29827.1 polyamine aminopropyltransferase [Xanthovirga aplysinae]
MAALGRHIIVELYKCDPEILRDVVLVRKRMEEAAQEAGATIINSTFHHFSPLGVSGVVVIQESHLAIHTWPEYGYAAVDLFTCGNSVNPWASYQYLKQAFKAEHGSSKELSRGEADLLSKNGLNFEFVRDQKSLENGKNNCPTDSIWFTERDENIALSLKHRGDKLFERQTPFQKVEVYDTYAYGKMLTLDGIVMTTEKDEYVYHEMIAHVPTFSHPNPKRALVVGGGDGGTVRELLRHESLDEVVMVEIDEQVIEASRRFLTSQSSTLDHPKMRLIIEDGIQFVKKTAQESFDLVIIDSTDPIGPGEGLFSESFYQDVYRVLRKNGIMVTQSESPRYNQKVFKKVFDLYKRIFGRNQVHCYLAHIPTYPSGMWSFSFCSKGTLHPLNKMNHDGIEDFVEKHDLQYYNSSIHQAAFALPGFVKKQLL